MFTGLIQATSKVVNNAGGRLVVALPSVGSGVGSGAGSFGDLAHGESIAVDGVCLTLTAPTSGSDNVMTFDVSPETLKKTTLGAVKVGAVVNLERAMRMGDRLGGHLVSGHVDGVATVIGRREAGGGNLELEIELPHELGRYVIAKGSLTVNGVSLTINELADVASGTRVKLMLIPVTLSATNLSAVAVGGRLNIEVDQMGKWVERLRGSVK